MVRGDEGGEGEGAAPTEGDLAAPLYAEGGEGVLG